MLPFTYFLRKCETLTWLFGLFVVMRNRTNPSFKQFLFYILFWYLFCFGQFVMIKLLPMIVLDKGEVCRLVINQTETATTCQKNQSPPENWFHLNPLTLNLFCFSCACLILILCCSRQFTFLISTIYQIHPIFYSHKCYVRWSVDKFLKSSMQHVYILNTAAIWIFCIGNCFFAMFNNFLTVGQGGGMENAWAVIFQQKAHSASRQPPWPFILSNFCIFWSGEDAKKNISGIIIISRFKLLVSIIYNW